MIRIPWMLWQISDLIICRDNENNFKIDKKNIVLEACYDNIKEDKDLLIGFDPDVVNKNRIEL